MGDNELGRRVRACRLQRGMSRTMLGDIIGVTFQQIQKYEDGVNSISAGRLQRISKALEVPISFFLVGFEPRDSDRGKSIVDLVQTSGSVKLLRAFNEIKDPKARELVIQMAARLATESSPAPAAGKIDV
jgi:transcriptional regulator with XRE-family HTH domain